MANPHAKCAIQWIPDGGPDVPTPDTNDAIGLAVYLSSGAYKAVPICAEHAKRFPVRGWALVFFPAPCFACAGTGWHEPSQRLCGACRGSGCEATP